MHSLGPLSHSSAPHMAGEVQPHGARPGGHICLPSFLPTCSFWPFLPFLSPVSWALGRLIQQQWGRPSRARRCGSGVEHEVQEDDTGVRLSLSGTIFFSSHASWSLDLSMTRVKPCHLHQHVAHLFHSPPPLKPPCLRAHCEFTLLACIYSTSIHKHMFVRWQRRRAVQELNGIRAPQQD